MHTVRPLLAPPPPPFHTREYILWHPFQAYLKNGSCLFVDFIVWTRIFELSSINQSILCSACRWHRQTNWKNWSVRFWKTYTWVAIADTWKQINWYKSRSVQFRVQQCSGRAVDVQYAQAREKTYKNGCPQGLHTPRPNPWSITWSYRITLTVWEVTLSIQQFIVIPWSLCKQA